jgi:hypothetical protein
MKNEKENKTNRHAPQVREWKGTARARICEKRGTTPSPPHVCQREGDVHLSGMGAVSGKGKRKGKKKRKEKERKEKKRKEKKRKEKTNYDRRLHPSKGWEKARPM